MKLSELPFGATFEIIGNSGNIYRISKYQTAQYESVKVASLVTGDNFVLTGRTEVKPVEVMVVKKDDYDKLSQELQNTRDRLVGADIFAGAIGGRLAERDRKIADMKQNIQFMNTCYKTKLSNWQQTVQDKLGQIANLRQIVADHIDKPEPALTFGDLSQFDLFTAGDDDILRKRICGDGNCFSIESGVYYGLSDSLPVTRMYADFASLE